MKFYLKSFSFLLTISEEMRKKQKSKYFRDYLIAYSLCHTEHLEDVYIRRKQHHFILFFLSTSETMKKKQNIKSTNFLLLGIF